MIGHWRTHHHDEVDFVVDFDDGAIAAATTNASNTQHSSDHITVAVHNGERYASLVLQSFRDKDTERVWHRQRSKHLDQQTQRAALRKLLILDAAEQLTDLRTPPGNRLEKLKGDRANAYSIRINDQWRICFRWTPAGADDVEIVDYH